MHTLQKRKSHTNAAVVISVASVQWFLVVAFTRRVYQVEFESSTNVVCTL